MGKTIRALPCHLRPFETERSLTGERITLRYGWSPKISLQALPLMIGQTKIITMEAKKNSTTIL